MTEALLLRIARLRKASDYWGHEGNRIAEDLHDAVGVINELVFRMETVKTLIRECGCMNDRLAAADAVADLSAASVFRGPEIG